MALSGIGLVVITQETPPGTPGPFVGDVTGDSASASLDGKAPVDFGI